MSQSKIEVVDDATSDVDADGVDDELCQLHIRHMQRLETPVECNQQLALQEYGAH